MATVGFIGLGVMGFPMAGHLSKAGHSVRVYNRTAAKSESWVQEHQGLAFDTPEAAASGADVVFVCVGNDNDVRDVVSGPQGALSAMKSGSVLVDHTTASAELARELAKAASEKDVGFIDAPVSGGQAGAENGALTIMCGGDKQAFDQVESVMACYARSCQLLGPTGSGQLTKMVNQLCITGLVQGLAEGLSFGIRAGLPMEQVIDVISKGAAQSWQMDNRARTMCQDSFDFGFAVDWMRKDLALCFAEAERNGAEVPVAKLVDQFYKEVQAMGGNRQDTSSLMRRLTE